VISHDRAQELISARMDAPLTAAEHRELNAHLASCDACRIFVANADDLARELHVMPRLAPSPAVSRAVMTAISTENTGWGWLRGALQTLSSPGMAVASGLALVVALAGAMLIAMNAPGGDGDGSDAEATFAAVAIQPLPTEVATETPAPEPTATQAPPRTISNPPTEPPGETPTPRPTETRVPIAARAEPTETPAIEPAVIEQPPIQPVGDEDPALAMAPEAEVAPVDTSADMAQAAEPVQTGEEVSQPEAAPEAAPAGDVAPEAAPENTDDGNGRRDGGRRDDGEQAAPEEPAAEPVATEAVPVPDEAIAAMESAEDSSEISLPPAPILPMPPEQAFLPITPTPVAESTPSPESDLQTDAPQLAEVPNDDLGVTALAPEPPGSDVVVSEPDVTVVEDEKIRQKEKKDKSSQDGKSHENQQSAYDNYAMGWSMAPIELAQSAAQPQTTDDAVATTTPAETGAVATTPEPAPQIDPATGLQIDAATGLLIDPTTGYLLDLVNGLVYHPGTGFQVHPMTGLLIDPATGAQLDPVTLAIVIPAGFGTDSPDYNPGDPAMRGQIETTVDDTYDDATYKVIPATDGPVQPVDEIIVPTESGEAIEVE
jgi:hypothetical protein